MARKTITVAEILDTANRALAAEWSTEEGRRAIIFMLEYTLHATGNYKGFSYLPSEYEEDPAKFAPGTTHLRIGYDNTRRAYIGPKIGE